MKTITETYRGTEYQIGTFDHEHFVSWRVTDRTKATGWYESSGGFYDDCADHPEGAVEWARKSVHRYIDGLRG